ncbi:hypothetical protein D1007_00505 [Hordeum vulgare]|nr:hypothetical protein D1007_00505 [Hordeum vulgare]
MHVMVDTHRSITELSVVYTNNPVWVEHSIHIVELLLAEEKYKVVGFDLEYTCARSGSRPKIVVAQMCMHNHVLAYNYYLATRPCEHFSSSIACQNLVDNQGQYKIWDNKNHEKDSLVHLAEAINDPYYRDMKD